MEKDYDRSTATTVKKPEAQQSSSSTKANKGNLGEVAGSTLPGVAIGIGETIVVGVVSVPKESSESEALAEDQDEELARIEVGHLKSQGGKGGKSLLISSLTVPSIVAMHQPPDSTAIVSTPTTNKVFAGPLLSSIERATRTQQESVDTRLTNSTMSVLDKNNSSRTTSTVKPIPLSSGTEDPLLPKPDNAPATMNNHKKRKLSSLNSPKSLVVHLEKDVSAVRKTVQQILNLLHLYGPLTAGQLECNLPTATNNLHDILQVLVALGIVQIVVPETSLTPNTDSHHSPPISSPQQSQTTASIASANVASQQSSETTRMDLEKTTPNQQRTLTVALASGPKQNLPPTRQGQLPPPRLFCVNRGIPRMDETLFLPPQFFLAQVDAAHTEIRNATQRAALLLPLLDGSRTKATASHKETLRQIASDYPEILQDPVYVTALKNLHVDIGAVDRKMPKSKSRNIRPSPSQQPTHNVINNTNKTFEHSSSSLSTKKNMISASATTTTATLEAVAATLARTQNVAENSTEPNQSIEMSEPSRTPTNAAQQDIYASNPSSNAVQSESDNKQSAVGHPEKGG